MPYNPGVTARGGEYIMRGAEIAGQALAAGIKGMRERHAESDYLDGAGQFYFKDDPERLAKFREGSVGTKRGMITGQQAQQAQQLQQKQQDMHDWQATDASARSWYGMTQEKESWQPPAEAMKAAADNGYLYLPQSPRSGTFAPMKSRSATPPLGSDPTGTGQFYFDGGRLKPVPTVALPSDVRTGIETTQSQIDSLDKQIREKQSEISSGNQRSGPDWLGFGKTYEEEIADLTKQKGDKLKKMDTLRYTGSRLPLAPSGMPPATPRPPAAGAPAPASPGSEAPAPATAQFKPGGVYANPKGEKARYNQDGTWTPLPDGASGGVVERTSPAAPAAKPAPAAPAAPPPGAPAPAPRASAGAPNPKALSMRSNNWLNVHSAGRDEWQGATGYNKDITNDHVSFETPELGLRAGALNLVNKIGKGQDTIRKIFAGMPGKPDTAYTGIPEHRDLYVGWVAKGMGLDPDAPLKAEPAQLKALVREIMKVEAGGIPHNFDAVADTGIGLALQARAKRTASR